MTARHYKLTIAFDGTLYHGWQGQRSGRGIRNAIAEACREIFGIVPEIVSSSRTDAGVHARGLVAHMELPLSCIKLTGAQLRLALNTKLPAAIRIVSATRANANFHARFDAKQKEYRYQVWNHPVMDPLLRQQAWHIPCPLDLDAIREAATYFIGRHDFRAFTAKRKGELLDSTRTLLQCQIKHRGKLLTFHLTGEGFLYKMCRRIVGTLIQVGEGKIKPAQVQALLQYADSQQAGMIAPAQGLILWKVSYR